MKRIPDEWLLILGIVIALVFVHLYGHSVGWLLVFGAGIVVGTGNGRGTPNVEGRTLGAVRAWLRRKANRIDTDDRG